MISSMSYAKPRLLYVLCALFLVVLLLSRVRVRNLFLSQGLTRGFSRASGHHVPGMEDIFVVMRTGASESEQKLPIHFETTLTAVPHFAIFSDLEQDVNGHHVFNVLDDVDEDIKQKNADFKYYNKLQQQGMSAFLKDEIASWPTKESGSSGLKDNPGWKLDKWKFLPMTTKALELRPDAKWFVFIEADTYVFWPSLVRWLSFLDPTEPHYIGRRLNLGETKFAYGGNGIIFSAAALHKITELRTSKLKDYDQLTAKKWAGDAILGDLVADAGIDIHSPTVVLSGEPPSEMDYAEAPGNNPLCRYNPISFHHMSSSEITSLWEAQKEMSKEGLEYPQYVDVFAKLVLPQLSQKKEQWDNLANDKPDNEAYPNAHTSFDECQNACIKTPDCKQFSYGSDHCRLSSKVKLGHAAINDKESSEVMSSGWMIDRIKKFIIDKC